MELLIEILIELILEGSIELGSNKKVPKIIRYPLVLLIILFFIVVIFGVIILGITSLDKNIWAGILLIILGSMLLIAAIIKFKKIYIVKR